MPNPHPDYYNLPFAQAVLGERMKAIERAVPAGSSILDLGCNDARISRELLRKGLAARVTGIDLCDVIVDKPQTLTFIRADLTHLDLDSLAKVDVVLLLNVVHHVVAESRERAKQLVDRLLEISSCVLCDMGSFTEYGEWKWRQKYDEFWESDSDMWDDLFENATHRFELLRYKAQVGGSRTLWELRRQETVPGTLQQSGGVEDYISLGQFRRVVSSIPHLKRLVPVNSTVDDPIPFGEEHGELCPDVLFYKLQNVAGELFWAKKWVGKRRRLTSLTCAIENFLRGLHRQDLCLAVALSETFGSLYKFDEGLFCSMAIVHYWNRHAYFTQEECLNIEAVGAIDIVLGERLRMSLSELTDFQIARLGGRLIYLDFEPWPEHV